MCYRPDPDIAAKHFVMRVTDLETAVLYQAEVVVNGSVIYDTAK